MVKAVNTKLSKFLTDFQELVSEINKLDEEPRQNYMLGLGAVTDSMKEMMIYMAQLDNKASVNATLALLSEQLGQLFLDEKLDDVENGNIMFSFPTKEKIEA